jgi:alpha-ketoglutarate-dependent taurine dioxygenase
MTNQYGIYALRQYENPNPLYPGTSNVAHPLHIDGAFLPVPERIVALQCVTPAESGGESVLASGSLVLAHVAEKFGRGKVEEMFQEGNISIRRDNQYTNAALLQRISEFVCFRYRHDIYSEIRIASEIEDAYKEMQEFLSQPGNFVEVTLAPNQILIIDNYGVLHGRNAFPDGGSREFNRMNFIGDGKLSGKLEYGVAFDGLAGSRSSH